MLYQYFIYQFVAVFLGVFFGTYLIIFFLMLLKRDKLRKQGLKVKYPQFKTKNVFLLQSPIYLAAIIATVVAGKQELLWGFILVGFVGMLAETLFSAVWSVLFSKPLWEYKLGGILNNYTAVVNFPAWSVSLVIFLVIWFSSVLVLGMDQQSYLAFSQLFFKYGLIGFTSVAIFFVVYTKIIIKRKLIFSVKSVVIYGILVMFYAVLAGLTSQWQVLVFVVISGLAGYVCEYLYGRVLEFVFGRKLWLYNYRDFYNFNTSLTNVFNCMIAAVLFIAVFAAVLGI